MIKKFLVIIFLGAFAPAFSQSDITPSVAEALKKGDAAALAAHFMGQVDLTILDEEGNFSKAEAQKLVAKFFATHNVTNFVLKHQGTSKLDDQYRIGDLTTSAGVFRVTFFIRKNGTTMQIKQLKVEE